MDNWPTVVIRLGNILFVLFAALFIFGERIPCPTLVLALKCGTIMALGMLFIFAVKKNRGFSIPESLYIFPRRIPIRKAFFREFLKNKRYFIILSLLTGCLSACVHRVLFGPLLCAILTFGCLFIIYQGEINGHITSNTGTCKKGTTGYLVSLIVLWGAYLLLTVTPLIWGPPARSNDTTTGDAKQKCSMSTTVKE